jgi:hypothetical protein
VHRVGDRADEPPVDGEADGGGEEALGDAERHVHALRVAPLGHDVAAPHDDAGGGAAHRERAGGLAERLAAERLVVRLREVARRLRLVGDGEGDRGGEAGRVDAELARRRRAQAPAGG